MESINQRLQAVTFDKSHGVEGITTAAVSKCVNRDDSRVFEATRDFGFQYKSFSGRRVVFKTLQDFLQRDFPVQFKVQRNRDFS